MENFRSPQEKADFILRLRDHERRVLEVNRDLIAWIKRVPHLDMGLNLDVEKMKSEVRAIQELRPHKLHKDQKVSQALRQTHEQNFKGVCLADIVADDFSGMEDSADFLFDDPRAQFENLRTQFFVTPTGQNMPYIMGRLSEISPWLNRTRLIKTPSGGGLPWHSHHNNVYDVGYLRLCILNVPIVAGERCLHGVRDFRGKGNDHWVHYEPGRCYMLNSWHDHCFWNKSSEDRIAVIPYFNFSDQQLLDHIARRLDLYTGPLLDTETVA